MAAKSGTFIGILIVIGAAGIASAQTEPPALVQELNVVNVSLQSKLLVMLSSTIEF